jgi:hypothetical protein
VAIRDADVARIAPVPRVCTVRRFKYAGKRLKKAKSGKKKSRCANKQSGHGTLVNRNDYPQQFPPAGRHDRLRAKQHLRLGRGQQDAGGQQGSAQLTAGGQGGGQGGGQLTTGGQGFGQQGAGGQGAGQQHGCGHGLQTGAGRQHDTGAQVEAQQSSARRHLRRQPQAASAIAGTSINPSRNSGNTNRCIRWISKYINLKIGLEHIQYWCAFQNNPRQSQLAGTTSPKIGTGNRMITLKVLGYSFRKLFVGNRLVNLLDPNYLTRSFIFQQTARNYGFCSWELTCFEAF